MADVSQQISGFRGAVSELHDAVRGIAVPVEAEAGEEHEIDTQALDAALDRYLAESDAIFEAAAASGDEQGTAQALAVVGVDLRFAAELVQVEQGPKLTASEEDTLGADLDEALDTVERGRPASAVLTDDPVTVDDVLAAIDGIVDAGTTTLASIGAAAVVPSGADLGKAAGALFGVGAGELVKRTADDLKGLWKKVSRAVTKLVGKVIDRISALFGKERAEQLEQWVERVLELSHLLSEVLDVDSLKDRARHAVPSNPDGARTAVAATARHASDIRWVGWGVTVLSLAKSTQILKTPPWGPILLGALTLALGAAGIWLTQDHLDAPGLDFLPDRVTGVGAALGA